MAYLEQNRREFELTKHVSLALLDPLALVQLRETGRCEFNLPEELFDLDYPGHYFRRIKSVSLSLPCVAGPYITIACTARLLDNSIRITTANGDAGYPRNSDDAGVPADDVRFVVRNIPVKAIAASSGQNDSDVFELNFRDERYLPFEGAGVVSKWSLELFHDANSSDFGRELRQFDYASITDAVLHVKYTAREDAGPFKNGVITHLMEHFEQNDGTPSMRILDLRREFPTQWHRFLYPTPADGDNVLRVEMSHRLFRAVDSGKSLKINRVILLARCTKAEDYTVTLTPRPVPPPDVAASIVMELVQSDKYGGMYFSEENVSSVSDFTVVPTETDRVWELKMTGPVGNALNEVEETKRMAVEDLLLILGYEWE